MCEHEVLGISRQMGSDELRSKYSINSDESTIKINLSLEDKEKLEKFVSKFLPTRNYMQRFAFLCKETRAFAYVIQGHSKCMSAYHLPVHKKY